ncbi:MAG: histidine--tRNA ligase [Candidatus Falkowbacteria bacterium]
MKDKISTKTLPGFNEYLPAEQLAFNDILDTIRGVYESYGFVPLDTPVLERQEVILAKAGGETEKQIYCLEKGDEKLALRFDLTVPLARYVSEHYNNLVFPFRRYCISKVYRGERPQRGRFRELYQADIDIVGEGELSLINDAEIVSIIYSTFSKLNFGDFTVRLNNRKLLTGFFESLSLSKEATDILRIVDKIDKVGRDQIKEILIKFEIEAAKVDKILEFITLKDNILESLTKMKIDNAIFQQGLSEIKEVVAYLEDYGVPASNYKIDLSIARGLDYYTGTVYETILNDYPQIGSVCSGGRYDDLAGYYSDRKLPGVGASIGLSRLFFQLQEADLIATRQATSADIFLVSENIKAASALANNLRQSGFSVLTAYGPEKFKKKLTLANRLGVKLVIILGEDEIAGGYFSLKDMTSGEQIKAHSIEEVNDFLK